MYYKLWKLELMDTRKLSKEYGASDYEWAVKLMGGQPWHKGIKSEWLKDSIPGNILEGRV